MTCWVPLLSIHIVFPKTDLRVKQLLLFVCEDHVSPGPRSCWHWLLIFLRQTFFFCESILLTQAALSFFGLVGWHKLSIGLRFSFSSFDPPLDPPLQWAQACAKTQYPSNYAAHHTRLFRYSSSLVTSLETVRLALPLELAALSPPSRTPKSDCSILSDVALQVKILCRRVSFLA